MVEPKRLVVTVRTEGIRAAAKKFKALRKEIERVYKAAKKLGLSKKQIETIFTEGWKYGERTKFNPAE